MKNQLKKILVLFNLGLIGMLNFSSAFTQNTNLTNNAANEFLIHFTPDTLKPTSKSPTGAMLRSLVFPGWGQFYNNKKLKALLIFGTEFGLLANSIYLNQKYQEWNQKYKDSEPGYEQNIILANREFYINNRNSSTWWLVGVILFSIADAFVDAHLSDFDESTNLSAIDISPVRGGRDLGIKLAMNVRF